MTKKPSEGKGFQPKGPGNDGGQPPTKEPVGPTPQPKWPTSETPLVHVYGQTMWHDTVDIVGTREGLKRLRDTIDAALESEDGLSLGVKNKEHHVFANDGEGYSFSVKCTEDIETLRRMPVAYTDEIAEERGEQSYVRWPFTKADYDSDL